MGSLRELKNSEETRREEDKNLNRKKEGEMRTLFRKIKSWKFKQVFGFVPEADSGRYSPDIRPAEQKIVDEALGRLAETYSTCDREERSLRKQMSVATREDVRQVREELLYARRMLHLAKSAFWYAHALAKKAGFSVKEKYTAYLPTSLAS